MMSLRKWADLNNIRYHKAYRLFKHGKLPVETFVSEAGRVFIKNSETVRSSITKLCIKCGAEKSIDDFSFRKDSKKHRNNCKACAVIKAQKNYEQNIEKTKQYEKERYNKVRLQNIEESKQRYIETLKLLAAQTHKQCTKCLIVKELSEFRMFKKRIIHEIERKYFVSNCKKCESLCQKYKTMTPEEKHNRNKKDWQKTKARLATDEDFRNKRRENKRNHGQRERSNPVTKMKRAVSAHILQVLKKNKGGQSTFKFLPYTPQQLKTHLESLFEPWMNWNNYGKYNAATWDDNNPETWTWQLDHIIPHSKFTYTNMESPEFQKCWALSNLRLYSAKQNVLDGNRRAA